MDPHDKRNIVLVGFMGTGKSVVGRLLARRLHRRRFDTDAWVISEASIPIAEIFQRFGEEPFREMETMAAREAASPQRLVVSTGGGILGRDENLALLRSGGVLIQLCARPEVILERTRPWSKRPLLSGTDDPLRLIEELLAQRAPRYALADWTIDTSDLALPEVVEKICEQLPFLLGSGATLSR